jgi:PAS domain S-box-containing protein
MGRFLELLLTPGQFLPHGLCLSWRPELIWTHLISDVLIGLAYFSIPIGLGYFVWKRQDLAFKWIFVMFGAFILSCGVTHFFGAWTLCNPDYVLQGGVKAVTAAVSIVTAALLWPLIPHALALPSPAQLRDANRELEIQILERRRAETAVRRINAELEQRVAERTAELKAANETLEARVAERTRELSEANERLRASEAHYAGIFNNMADGIFVIRLDDAGEFRFEALNPSHEQQTGLRTSAIADHTPHELFDRELADQLVGNYRRCVSTDGVVEYEETLDLPAGLRTYQTRLTPIHDAAGRVVKLIGTARDVTEHRTLQEELAQASKMATLGTMAAGIAHEMSQPLNIIRITADDCRLMIRDGDNDPVYLGESLELIGSQAKRMGEIVDQMRSFSRRDNGDTGSFDPAQPVRRAVTLLDRHYASEGITIGMDLSAGPAAVAGQPGRLEQVMLNLLSNARDAITARRAADPSAESGHIDVAVAAEATNRTVRIQVTDDGIGIPADLVVERIFDPFFTTKDVEKGLGLGLSICASIINAMGGRITAERLAHGTRFTITLPMRRATAEAHHD